MDDPRAHTLDAERALTDLARFPALGVHLAKGAVLERRADDFRATAAIGKMTTTIPSNARGAVRLGLRDRGDVWIEIVADGLAPTPGAAIGNAVVFAGAASGADVIDTIEPDRFEEIRILRTPAAPTTASYTIRIGPGLSRIRAREGRIEALDDKGYVHLATAPMFAVDSRGARRDLDVEVSSTSGAWTVRAILDTRGLVYPIVVDPKSDPPVVVMNKTTLWDKIRGMPRPRLHGEIAWSAYPPLGAPTPSSSSRKTHPGCTRYGHDDGSAQLESMTLALVRGRLARGRGGLDPEKRDRRRERTKGAKFSFTLPRA